MMPTSSTPPLDDRRGESGPGGVQLPAPAGPGFLPVLGALGVAAPSRCGRCRGRSTPPPGGPSRAACDSRCRPRPRRGSARSHRAARGPPWRAPSPGDGLFGVAGTGRTSSCSCPRSRSDRTKTGVWKRSAMSNASTPKAEALLHRGREEEQVLGVTVGEEGGGEHVPLRGSGRKPGGGSDPLHVPDDRRDLGEVAQPDEFAHERDARTGGRRHGARSGPARRPPPSPPRPARPRPARWRRWLLPSAPIRYFFM